jgi:putative hemolysin
MILLDPDLDPDPSPRATATKRTAAGLPSTPRDLRLPTARTLARFLSVAQAAVRLRAILMVVLLAALVETLASYISRVYSEFGKILTREVAGKSGRVGRADRAASRPEPRARGHLRGGLQQLSLGIIALEFGAVLFDRAPHLAGPPMRRLRRRFWAWCWWWFSATSFFLRCSSTARGAVGGALVWPIRLLLWLVTPITVFIRFFFSVAALAEEPASPEEEPAVDVEALLEAGEEEGILEESDRDLVRSAVEFGDKLVREVMTPRPEIFAVPNRSRWSSFWSSCASTTFRAFRSTPARSTT